MRELLSKSKVRLWLAVVGSATLLLGAAYTMVQQSTRLSADDLPLTTAQSVNHQLEKGATPQDVVPPIKTDLRSDLSVFVIITDGTQHVLASSAELDGKTPLPPVGVFNFTTAHQTDHFTWQPNDGVRLATRVMSFANSSSNGFIITGHSLAPFENRVNVYNTLALLAWVATLAWTTFLLLLPIDRTVQKPSNARSGNAKK